MINEVSLSVAPRVAAVPELLKERVADALGLKTGELHDICVTRRSIDARNRNVKVNLTMLAASGEDHSLPSLFEEKIFPDVSSSGRQILIVGAGPAGLFAALKAIELGYRPIVFERGKDVDSRRLDITRLNRERRVLPESNYCFGEGGAGTFSDGKLFTRSKKKGNVKEVLNLLVQHGAAENILIESHPHIGSDRLPLIIKNIRQTIISHGGEVHFRSRVSDLIMDDSDGLAVKGVRLEGGQEYSGPVILATGHSARDIYEMLGRLGIRLEAKGLAIGVRLEHPRQLIDKLQYHSSDDIRKYLPAAEYSFVTQVDSRGVYSFCMCPGGVVVPAGSYPGELVVNGMSASARAGRWSNSGIVVEVHPGDIEGYGQYGELEMLRMQEDLERKFFGASDNTINAPAQRMADFTESKESRTLPETSYVPGIHPARIDQLLPLFISRRLQEGMRRFGQKCKGFLTNEAVLIGLESRTSSPVRIPRDKETFRHTDVKGLYPAGEGAGYAGGIVSAAMDGINSMVRLDAERNSLCKSL